ncbi:xanthine dehydrogenase small subunit [bacterium]|nr:xanthine dehydrogenase small subunit [bacterium]
MTRDKISFVLDGQQKKVAFTELAPTTTVLNYLRSLPGHKGVKEGCAEGDCGACTVVMAEKGADGKLSYKGYNSCLVFLPMVEGKQLITVEEVGKSDSLHPIQKAMVETDGSQCGYCTPGFIMSMLALYKNSHKPSRAEIDDALTGNLCRCTGYRPIIEAAAQACVNHGKDHFAETEPLVIKLLDSIERDDIDIQTPEQQYFRPASLGKALELRTSHPDALLITGATDIALRVTKSHEVLEKIIDLSGIESLKKIEVTEEGITFGAGASLEAVRQQSKEKLPALYDCLSVFGSVMIRNLASLGGNLGTSSPIGDTPPILMAYDATVILTGPNGNREVPVREFITGYRAHVTAKNEIIHSIQVPFPGTDTHIKWYKVSKRKDLDISTVSAGFRLNKDSSGRAGEIHLYYGGMAAQTQRASKAESFLEGKPWSRSAIEGAMDILAEDFFPISDARASAEGRRVIARNLLLKFWVETSF